MLPGLSLTVSEDIHFCSFLEKLDKDIKNNTVGSLSSYLSSSCLRTCHNLIKIKLSGNDCSVNDKNPAIRKMLLHSLHKKDIGSYISDPCHFVRAKAIEMSKPRIELLEHLNDLCVDVRLAVLDKLGDFKFLKRLNRSEQQSIFVEICERINDIEVSVRQKVSAVLRNFTLISTEQIHNMLTKTDEHMKIKLGTFVHGLEDENEVVRINIICSMCKLIKTDKTANVVFDFLLDALNDVIERVKETAGMNIYEMAKMFKVNVNSEMVDMIFFNFEEKNEDVKMHLFNVIPHLVFDNETLRHTFVKFRKLLDKNIDKERIFYCIKKLTCENVRYFRDYIDQNEVFNRPKEPPLNNNKHYMHVIVLAEVLKKGYDVKYKMYLEKHLFYYRMKDAQIYLKIDNMENVECISEIDTVKKQRLDSKKDLKYFICKFLENIGDGDKSILYYKNLFRSNFAKTPLDMFYVKLFKAISRVMRFNEYSLYERLKVIYNFDVEIGDLHAYVSALDGVVENAFCISCLPRISKKFMLPLQLRVKVYYTREVSNAFIKIYNKDFTKYYGLRKDSMIYIYEEAKSISVCIVKKLDTNDILLTKSHKIIIE